MNRIRGGVTLVAAALVLLGPAVAVRPVLAGPLPSSIPTVPKAHCQPGDKVETALQGQVPWADRLDGRAAQGYSCNLKLIGGFNSIGHISLDTYKNCAYYSDTSGGGLTGDPKFDTGTIALDVSDPTHPVKTAYLTTPAMGGPWESLKVNNKRGLLVADHNGQHFLDVYDVSQDCRHPKLLSKNTMQYGVGHEGWFTPDGQVYFMSAGGPVTPIDLYDPAHPREITTWNFAGTIHGGSVSEDGTRGYFAQMTNPDGMLIVDLSDLRKANGNKGRVISTLAMPDTAANQATYPLNYNGHPYVIDFGELTNSCSVVSTCPSPVGETRCPSAGDTNFSYPKMVDVADEKNPKIVAKFQNEVDDPANCPLVEGDNSPNTLGLEKGDTFGVGISALFVYDAHMCSPDRLHNPTILACAQVLSGVRVYDIRDPIHPKELAYINMGALSATDPTIDRIGARPVIRTDLGQIWFVTDHTGFHVAQFENGVWPFKDSQPCPLGFDYYQAQYDLNYDSCLAAQGGTEAASTTPIAVSARSLPNSSRDHPVIAAVLALLFLSGMSTIAHASIRRARKTS